MKKIKNFNNPLTHIFILIISILIIASLLQVNFAANETIINENTTGGINQGIINTTDNGKLILDQGTYNKSGGQDYGITIDKNITIQGNGGPESVKIDAGKSSRIFTIANNTNVTFINLTFLNGNATDFNAGGAIYNPYTNSVLTFINCLFINNTESNIYSGTIMVVQSTIMVTICL